MTTQKTVTAEDVERWSRAVGDAVDALGAPNDIYDEVSLAQDARVGLAALRDTAAQVPALQARVAELERELRIRDDDHRLEQEGRLKAESERDALRAQVERLRKSMDTAGHMIGIDAPATAEVVLREALSTPPAEAKTAEAPRGVYGDGMTPSVPGPATRSCNAHEDCNAESGPCCNDHTCPDHWAPPCSGS